jgi:hypothetical protein
MNQPTTYIPALWIHVGAIIVHKTSGKERVISRLKLGESAATTVVELIDGDTDLPAGACSPPVIEREFAPTNRRRSVAHLHRPRV